MVFHHERLPRLARTRLHQCPQVHESLGRDDGGDGPVDPLVPIGGLLHEHDLLGVLPGDRDSGVPGEAGVPVLGDPPAMDGRLQRLAGSLM